jgi:hypothetical protein
LLIASVPLSIAVAFPVRRTEKAVKSHPVCDAFNQTAWTSSMAVVLKAVNELMSEHTVDFFCTTRYGVDVGNILD